MKNLTHTHKHTKKQNDKEEHKKVNFWGKKKESGELLLVQSGIMGFGIRFSAPEGNQESVTVTIEIRNSSSTDK